MARRLYHSLLRQLTAINGTVLLAVLAVVVCVGITSSTRSNAQIQQTGDTVTRIVLTGTTYGTTFATLNYTTDADTLTTVAYGTSPSSLSAPIDIDGAILTSTHVATLTGLTPSTTYYFVITATSADGTVLTSTDANTCVNSNQICEFNTVGIDVSNIAVNIDASTNSAATITFISNSNLGGSVNWGVSRNDLDTGVSLPAPTVISSTEYSYAVTLTGLPHPSPILFEIVQGTSGTGGHTFYMGPVSITDGSIAVSTAGPVNLTWTTDLPGTHVVHVGTDQNAINAMYSSQTPVNTSHSVSISHGLSAGTTYYYTVTSTLIPDVFVGPTSYTDANYTATSAVGPTFTTSGVSSSTPLTFSPDPSALASSDSATITFGTSIATSALVEFNTNPGLAPDPRTSGYSKVCDSATVCTSLPPIWQAPGMTNHTIKITGLADPDRDYYYRVTVIDQLGRKLSTAVLKFRPFDHKFSTGQCADGTALRTCKDGMYCRPGGIGPVYDCHPGLECTYQCPTGTTCQDTGDCTADPAPGNSLTACNPKSCYMQCDNRSGSMSGKRCSVDADCNTGKCTTGDFVIPAAPGCYSSWSSCDANVILKVKPDRVCDMWYTCKSSIQVTTSSGTVQNQCLDLTICDSLSPNGQCNNLLEGWQCSNDPLRFCKQDSDCIGANAYCFASHGQCSNDATKYCSKDSECGDGAYCIRKLPLTFNAPQDVGQIKGLTGMIFAGLNWHEQPGICSSESGDKAGSQCYTDSDCGTGTCQNAKPVINGLYPLSLAEQKGQRIDLPDGDFESYAQVFQCAKNTKMSCSLNKVPDDCIVVSGSTSTDYGPCVANRDTQKLIARYWKTITPSGSVEDAAISVDADMSSTNPNQMLKISPSDLSGSGAQTTSLMNLTTSATAQYILTVSMKTSQQGQKVQVAFVNSAGDVNVIQTVTLGTSWQQYMLGPANGVGGNSAISFTTVEETDQGVPFWIDNLSIVPALKVSDTGPLIPQSCRIYPNSSSPSCDYTDSNGLSYQGYKGYCLERDPMNAAVCLSWWPVDIIAGNNIFGTDISSGYNDRQPLYICAEAKGAWDPPLPATATFSLGKTFNTPYCDDSGETSRTPDRLFGSNTKDCGIERGPYLPMTTRVNTGIEGGDGGNCNDIENVGGQYPGFQFCRHKGMDPTFFDASKEDRLIHDYDIEYFRVHILRYNRNGDSSWSNIVPPGDIIASAANNWTAQSGDNADNCAGETINLKWDATDHHLLGYTLHAQRCAEHEDAMSGFYAIGLFYMKEQCTKLVQVATQDQVLAWTDRTSKTGTYVVPGLNYRYVSDLSPFGAAAPPSTVLNPNEWQNQGGPGVLSIEGPDVSQSYPYQMRGGEAYACNGDCSGRICTNATGSKVGYGCFTSADCLDTTSSPPVTGQCVGNGVCLTYNSTTNAYSFDQNRSTNGGQSYGPESCTTGYVGGRVCNSNSGKRAGRTCAADSDCQYTVGKCVNISSATHSGTCDANSGAMKGATCYSDDSCQTKYNGACVLQGSCPAGQKCCSQPNEVCVGGQASGTLGRGTQKIDSETSISTTTSARVCSVGGTLSGLACANNSDCQARCTQTQGRTCSNLPSRTCTNDANCVVWSGVIPVSTGTCLDVVSTCTINGQATSQSCTSDKDCGGSCVVNSSAYFAQYNIMRLFAKAYSVWQWTNNVDECSDSSAGGCYVNTTSRCDANSGTLIGKPCSDNSTCGAGACVASGLWSQPTITCKVCSGGPNPNKACTSNASCGAGGTCVDSPNHPTTNAPGETFADYCAVKPTIFNVLDAGKSVLIDEGSAYALQFNSTVDANQRPLTGISIDWGDGTDPTVESGLMIAPHDDPANPHIFTHVYHCQQTNGVCYPYYIKVRITDNWGWCSNGTGLSGGILCGENPRAFCNTARKCAGGERDGLSCASNADCLAWTDGPIIQVLK